MSTKITGRFGNEWIVNSDPEEGTVAIDSRRDAGNRVFKVSDLLDAMKAEGVLDGEFVALPEVKPELRGRVIVNGITMSTEDGAEWHRKLGLNHLAIARHLEGEEALAAKAKEAEESKAGALKARRDDLVNQLVKPDSWQWSDLQYMSAPGAVRRAVDQIIELEDQLSAK